MLLQQRKALMAVRFPRAAHIALPTAGADADGANQVDLLFSLIDPLNDVLVEDHPHAPEQIDKRPDAFRAILSIFEEMLLEQGEQLAVQQSRQVGPATFE